MSPARVSWNECGRLHSALAQIISVELVQEKVPCELWPSSFAGSTCWSKGIALCEETRPCLSFSNQALQLTCLSLNKIPTEISIFPDTPLLTSLKNTPEHLKL